MTRPQTIPHLATAAARQWPDGEAVVDRDLRLSFRDLEQRMLEAAAAFVAAGLQPGERVALWLQNSCEWIVAALGLQAAGGVLVPLNTRFKGEEVRDILDRARVAMLVIPDEFLGVNYREAIDIADLASLRRIVTVGEDGPAGWSAFLAGADKTARKEAEARLASLSPTDLCDIMFTSGTSGRSKGVLSSHGQVVSTAFAWVATAGLGPKDRFLVLWPFFHSAGYKMGWVACLVSGATALPEAVLDPVALVSRAVAERVSFLPGPPTLFLTLLADETVAPRALASVRMSMTGGSTIPPSMIEGVRTRLGIAAMSSGYGLTESQGVATLTRIDDPPERVAFTSGKAVAGVEVQCIDSAGRPVPPGEQGEIVVRGPNVMLGYLDDPAATNETIDADGWLHTGDLGVLDEQGYLRVTGRIKDVFIVGGFNCYPAEIEKVLLEHDAIAQVAISAAPDDRLGEVGIAHVVLAPGAKLTADELIDWARKRMANYKVPRHVRFTASLPVNASGKVLRHELPQVT